MSAIKKILCVLCFFCICAPLHAAASFTYTSSSGILYEFTPERMGAVLNGREVLSGIWSAQGSEESFDTAANNTLFGPITEISLAKVSSNSVRITQTYEKFKTVTTWRFSGEDAHITFVVSNLKSARTVDVLEFSGLTVQFNARPTGFFPSWHWTYLRHVGVGICHPSLWVPVGAVWAADDEFGFSAYTLGRLDRPKLLHAEFEDNGIIPAASRLQFFVPEPLELGQTKTFDLHLRLSADRTWQHLLEPYKKDFRSAVPAVQYKHEDKPMAYFASADPAWVRRDNPYGFNDGGDGSVLWRRFDKPDGVASFLQKIGDPITAAGASGCMFWALQGSSERGAMYRPDFDVFPPQIAANIPALAKGFADRGLRMGLCARPGEGVDRTDWDKDGTFRLSAQSKDQMARLLARFKNAKAMGFNLFYLDSFGADYNDLLIMRKIRAEIGDVPTYSEYTSDVILPLTGRYLERRDKAFPFATEQTLTVQRWLVDGAGFIVKNVDGGPVDKQPLSDFKVFLLEDWLWVK